MKAFIDATRQFSTRRFFKKRTILLYQGEAPRAAYIMKDGLLKMYGINPQGEEQVVSLLAPGDIFPLPWIFGQAPNALFYYEAVTDSEVLTLPKDDLLAVINKQPALHKKMFDYFVSRHTGMLLRINALEQTRALEKIVFTLYYLLFHYGERQPNGIYTLCIKLTQPMLASLVGLTRETTAKCLTVLRRRGIISYKRFEYTIDKAKLERYLGEDSFADLVLATTA